MVLAAVNDNNCYKMRLMFKKLDSAAKQFPFDALSENKIKMNPKQQWNTWFPPHCSRAVCQQW